MLNFDSRWLDVVAAILAIVGGIVLMKFQSAGTHGYSFGGRNIFETALTASAFT